MKLMWLALFTITLSSCFSTANEELDIPLSATDKVVIDKENPEDLYSPKETKTVNVSSVVRWQNFFREPPNKSEKKLIETSLLKWIDKDSVSDLLKKSRNEIVIGRLKNAEISLREALRIDADNIDILLELASLYLKMQELPRAFETLESLKSSMMSQEQISTNFKFRYRYILALGYLARGDDNLGRDVLSDLIAIDKTFVPAYIALASSYVKQDKLNVAEFIAQRGIDRGKEHPALYNILGVIEKNKGFYESAERWFSKALMVQSSYAPAMVNKANLLISQFQYQEAKEYLIQALSNEPSNIEALISLGVVNKKNGDFEGSKLSLMKALEIDPESSIARFNLGLLMLTAYERPNEAIRLFYEVVQTSSHDENLKKTAENYIEEIKENRESY